MSLLDCSPQIQPALDQLKLQNAQKFSFEKVEVFLHETRTSDICDSLGVSADLINRYREEGLTVDEADRVACKLHQHVGTIWPEWFEIEHIPNDVMDAVEQFMTDHKECIGCHEWMRREGNFYRRSASRDGFARFCKKCSKIADAEKLNARSIPV